MSGPARVRQAAAAALATAAVSVCLAPLIDDRRWLLAAWVVVAVIGATGAIVRMLVPWWPVVVAAQVGMLAVMVTVLFAGSTALLGLLPGPQTAAALAALWADGLEVTRAQAPPVAADTGVTLIAVTGVALVALVTDVVAVSLRRPALAGLPLLAVYCVPAALLRGGLAWHYFVLAGIGFLVLVAADSGDRIRGWGRVLTTGSGRSASRTEGLGRGGRRIAAACLVVAAALPSAIPGLGERLIGGQGAGPGEGDGDLIRVVNPILDLRRNLTSQSEAVVLRYRTSNRTPALMRIVADTRFDGRIWSPPAGRVAGDNQVGEGLDPPPGLGSVIKRTELNAAVTVGPLAQTYLPLPYPATQVEAEGNWLFDPSTLNVIAGNRQTTTEGLSYRVDYLDVQPTPEQLRATRPSPLDTSKRDLLQVPDGDAVAAIAQQAREIAGDGSAYEQAANLQKFFRSGSFRYSTTAPRSDDPADDGGLESLRTFLRSRSGYCVHFASSMALMARVLGIPARVAVGFLPGTPGANGFYEVRAKDAHAWPELYFDGIGWLRFEPTPSARVAAVPGYTIPPVETTAAPSVEAPSASRPTGEVRPDQGVADQDRTQSNDSTVSRLFTAVPWRTVAVLLLIAMLAALPALATVLVRRRRWRRAADRTTRAETAWEELGERISDLGASWASSWTPRDQAGRVASDHQLGEDERAALGRLVQDLESARYTRPEAGRGRDRRARITDVRTVSSAVAAGQSAWIRRRARWWPASGVQALLTLARTVDVAQDRAGSTMRQSVGRLGFRTRSLRTRGLGSRGKGRARSTM